MLGNVHPAMSSQTVTLNLPLCP